MLRQAGLQTSSVRVQLLIQSYKLCATRKRLLKLQHGPIHQLDRE
jgi:hypothetical protein